METRYELTLETQYPSDLPSWIEISHLYDGLEYSSFYKTVRGGIVNPGETKHSYILFDTMKDGIVYLNYKTPPGLFSGDNCRIYVTQSPECPDVDKDYINLLKYIGSNSITSSWLSCSTFVKAAGTYYLHILLEVPENGVRGFLDFEFKNFLFSAPTFPLSKTIGITENIIPKIGQVAELDMTERITNGSVIFNDHYVNFLEPVTDDSPLIWTATEEVTMMSNRLTVTPKYYIDAIGSITIVSPYSHMNKGIRFKLYAKRSSYSRLTVYLNGEYQIMWFGADVDQEFYYETPRSYVGDTVIEIRYNYSHGSYIYVEDVCAEQVLNSFDIFETVEPMNEKLALKETVKLGSYFKLREKIATENDILGDAFLTVNEKVRDFELTKSTIYLDEYVLPKSSHSRLTLREKSYASYYTGKTGKVMIEVIK